MMTHKGDLGGVHFEGSPVTPDLRECVYTYASMINRSNVCEEKKAKKKERKTKPDSIWLDE